MSSANGAGAKPAAKKAKQFYFDTKGMLKNQQTDMMMDTESVLNGNLGEEVLPYVSEYVEDQMENVHNLQRIALPSVDAPAHCDIFVSPELETFDNILVITTNKRDTKPGIWSRGLCISDGLEKGSMLSTIKAAQGVGYGIVILNARTNVSENLLRRSKNTS